MGPLQRVACGQGRSAVGIQAQLGQLGHTQTDQTDTKTRRIRRTKMGVRWAWDGVSMMRYDEDGPQFVASATISWLFMRERPSTTPLTPRRDARKDVVVMFQETLLFYTLQVWDDLRWWHGRSWDLGSTYCWFWRCGFSNLGIVHVVEIGYPITGLSSFPHWAFRGKIHHCQTHPKIIVGDLSRLSPSYW